jgi:hypothetical protein
MIAYEDISKWTIADLDREVLPARGRDEQDVLLRVSAFIDRKIYNSERIWRATSEPHDKTRLKEKVKDLLTHEEFLRIEKEAAA